MGCLFNSKTQRLKNTGRGKPERTVENLNIQTPLCSPTRMLNSVLTFESLS
jgi:hypothetical protein